MEYTPPKRPEWVKNLVGKVFGSLTVTQLLGNRNGSASTFYRCTCVCGAATDVAGGDLGRGHTTSCGCQMKRIVGERNTRHGRRNTPEYKAWSLMKDRCLNPNHQNQAEYAGRGITVCERWLESFENFYADMGNRPGPTYSLDRKDNSKGYTPENCRWATKEEQSNNRRINVAVNFEGTTYTIAELARHLKLDYNSFYNLYRFRKLSLAEAVTRAKRL